MDLIVYGIPNCDTVKKAKNWLADHRLNATFHDFKKQGVPPEQLDRWMAAVGWETLLNRKGSTWRKLDAAQQTSVKDSKSAQKIMLEHPSTIKRPVISWPSGALTVGFTPDQWPV